MSKQPTASQWSRPSRTTSDAPTYPLQVGRSSQCPGLASPQWPASQRLSCLGPALVETVIERANDAHTAATTHSILARLTDRVQRSVPYSPNRPLRSSHGRQANCHAVLATELAASLPHRPTTSQVVFSRALALTGSGPCERPQKEKEKKEREREESNKVEQIYRTRA